MIGIGTIFRRRAGSGGPLPPDYAKWVKEHMVFWYDMSKPVDTYIPGVTYANPFVNGGGKLTYDNAINKCIITHTPTNNNNIAFWQIIVKPLQYVESYKIRVTGLPTGFTIKGRFRYDDIQITSDGEYDIPEYRNSSTTNVSYPGFYLAGDNVNDVDCNIVVEEIPTKQSVPTNEILKANPYLQDHSGNNRPLKLNNFLFAAMSGVGGYNISSTNILPDRANVTVTDNRIIHITKKLSTTDNMVNIVPANSNPTHKFKITGLSDGRQVSLVNRNEDCVDGLKRFSDNHFDLAIVDPPYGIGINKGGHTLAGNGNFKGGNFKVAARKYKGGEWDNEPPPQEYFEQLFRVSKNQIVWGANHFIERMPFNASGWIVWDKDNGESYQADCELSPLSIS